MKSSIILLTTVLFAFAALTFLVSYTRPAADEPKEYMVVSVSMTKGSNYNYIADLQKQVNQKLSEGWHLQGGVSNSAGFSQALVK